MSEQKKDMAYSALVSACTDEIKGARSNIPAWDQGWLDKAVEGGDIGMLGSYGAMISNIRKHSTLTDSQIKYQLNKDDRVISRSSGAGTCKIWYPKGLHVELGLSAAPKPEDV
ncbi:hypothetical protein [Vreelandella populi]|uniref:hypothetical protein n=1 Tax=Vreelandella populi TaxID=2498858 RepID=UPI000F8EF724|nr:hypothetical protein [Halomonas populi]RUR52747.1 hypothetical protein ELY40_11905 [Halomonas populi]